jgi:ATP-dependent DNA ligase
LGLAKSEQIARFITPMECLPVGEIPEGDLWTYELKLDGYRFSTGLESTTVRFGL